MRKEREGNYTGNYTERNAREGKGNEEGVWSHGEGRKEGRKLKKKKRNILRKKEKYWR